MELSSGTFQLTTFLTYELTYLVPLLEAELLEWQAGREGAWVG